MSSLFRVRVCPAVAMSVVHEINERFCADAWRLWQGDWEKISRMSIINHAQIRPRQSFGRQARVWSNGVSKSAQRDSEKFGFQRFAVNYMYPERFTNVTNGIAHRRWLCLCQPAVGRAHRVAYRPRIPQAARSARKAACVSGRRRYAARAPGNRQAANKADFSNFVYGATGILLDPDSIFDVQVRRLHEYKRRLSSTRCISSICISR